MVTPSKEAFDWSQYQTPESVEAAKQPQSATPTSQPQNAAQVQTNRPTEAQVPEQKSEAQKWNDSLALKEKGWGDTGSEEENAQGFSFNDYLTPETYAGEPDPTADESTLGYLTRHLVTGASDLLTTFAGRYGNLQEIGKHFAEKLPESTGLVGLAIHDLVGPERWRHLIMGDQNPEMTGGIPQLPTSQELKNVSQTITGGYTKPKTPGEEKFHGVIEDIGTTIGGRSGAHTAGAARLTPARRVLLNNIGIPAAANAAKEAVAGLGFDETKQESGKMGAWLALSLAGNVNAPAYAAQLMNQGRRGFPRWLHTSGVGYQRDLNVSARRLYHGDPRTAAATTAVRGIEDDIAQGKTSMIDLMNRLDANNALKREKGFFALGGKDRRYATNAIDNVNRVVRERIRRLGGYNPQAYEQYRNGLNAFATIHRSNAMTKFAQETLHGGPLKKALGGSSVLSLFTGGSIKAYQDPAMAGLLAAAGGVAYQSYKVGQRVWQDPVLARYYWQAMSAAAQENAASFTKNFGDLDKAYKKKYGFSLLKNDSEEETDNTTKDKKSNH